MIDLASRKVVGWALADHMRTELISDALLMAFGNRRPPAGVIFHSDRGCQYTSRDFRQLAIDHGVVLSLGRKGDCWDNAVAESFFATSNESSSTAAPGRPWPAAASRLRLDRRLVQHPPAPLLPRLPQPGPIRSPYPPKPQPPGGIIDSTNLSVKPRQPHFPYLRASVSRWFRGGPGGRLGGRRVGLRPRPAEWRWRAARGCRSHSGSTGVHSPAAPGHLCGAELVEDKQHPRRRPDAAGCRVAASAVGEPCPLSGSTGTGIYLGHAKMSLLRGPRVPLNGG